MSEAMSFHLYPYMDSIKKEKLEAAARFRRLQYLHGAIKVLLFASVCFCLCRFVLPPDLPESLGSILRTLNCYIGKLGMFFLCNAIFAFLVADSGMVARQPSPSPDRHEDRLMNSSQSEGKELMVCVSLGKEEACGGDGSIVNWESEGSLAVGAGGKQGVAMKWEIAPVPQSEEKELALEVSEERRRKLDDGCSGNFRSTEKTVFLGNEQRITSWKDDLAGGTKRQHGAKKTWEMVPVPPSEEEECTFKISEEEKRKWNDARSGNLWPNQKFESLLKEQRISSWELVPVPPTMEEEEDLEDINQKCADFIAKTKMTWKQESMQLVVV